jgi:hypothetical protein
MEQNNKNEQCAKDKNFIMLTSSYNSRYELVNEINSLIIKGYKPIGGIKCIIPGKSFYVDQDTKCYISMIKKDL